MREILVSLTLSEGPETQSAKMNTAQFRKRLPLVSVLNTGMDGMVRWCTPSIHPECPLIRGIYSSDISVSYHALGNPSQGTGIFGNVYKLAAKAYKADNTLFSVNGSTGSIFIVLRALTHQLKKVKMLAQRNIHKSVSVAIEDYKIDATFLSPHYDDKYQVFIPNTIDEYVDALRKDQEINLVFLTNPTYEGLSLDLPALVKAIRKVSPKVVIFVDEAWGSHFPFSKLMPVCAMEAGVDICVQSTHKQGSALQQTSMIHWKNKFVDKKYLLDSYKSLMTTSPSFHLLASLDGARYLMETRGEFIIKRLIDIANVFRNRIKDVLGMEEVSLIELGKKYKQVECLDRSKILINLGKCGISGISMAHYLQKDYKVIVEKYEMDNILFLNTFQNNEYDVEQTIRAMKKIAAKYGRKKMKKAYRFPKFPVNIEKQLPSFETGKQEIVSVNLERATGLIAAEDVVPYPPGIPLIVKGEKVSPAHINYLMAIKRTNHLISAIMNDKSINSILVIKN